MGEQVVSARARPKNLKSLTDHLRCWYLRLSSNHVVDTVMKAKRNLNSLHTRDTNRERIDEEHASRMINSKIYINEALTASAHHELL